MTSENFSRRFNCGIALGAIVASFLFFPSYGKAQDQQQDYTPPPMFEDSGPMKRPDAPTGNLFEGKSSIRTPENTVPMPRPAEIGPRAAQPSEPISSQTETATPVIEDEPNVVAAPVVPQTNTAAPVTPIESPKTPPKMMEPIIDEKDLKRQAPVSQKVQEEPKTVSKDETTAEAPKTEAVEPKAASDPLSAPEPVVTTTVTPAAEKPESSKIETPSVAPHPARAKPPVPRAKVTAAASEDDRTQPLKTVRDPNVSAIKGPKTMPSLPMENVDAQKTFDSGETSGETILERHQHEAKAAKSSQIPAAVAPPPGVTPATFDTNEKDILKKTIPYQAGQIGLEKADAQAVAAGVATELDQEGKEQWRAQIRSYATSFGNGLSSDRRIALSRALSLRTYMIESGVPASRIDIIAEGLAPGSSGAADRVDLFLFGPNAR